MKEYTVTFTATDNNETVSISSRNDGFTLFEMIALLELKKNDIFAQMYPNSNFKRVFVDSNGNEVEVKEEQ